MGVFRQLGDPLAGAVCLCQHHGAAYAKLEPTEVYDDLQARYNTIAANTPLVQVAITITERCCIAVTSTLIVNHPHPATNFEIERPIGTIRTTQEDVIVARFMHMIHHGVWEVLNPGTYTYYLMNRSGAGRMVYGAWIKAIASDCEA